jgi:hypothetical protein
VLKPSEIELPPPQPCISKGFEVLVDLILRVDKPPAVMETVPAKVDRMNSPTEDGEILLQNFHSHF